MGVQRQYTATAGRIENAQVAVYPGYGTDRGCTLMDRALYLPEPWVADPARRDEVGVPETVEFATKGQLGVELVARFFDSGGNAAWLTGDEVYGSSPDPVEYAEGRGLDHVLAIRCNQHLTTVRGQRSARADEIIARLGKHRCHTLAAGQGTKGSRLFDWARVEITGGPDAVPGHRWLKDAR